MVSDGTSPSEDQSGNGYNGAHVDLHRLRLRLQEILASIHAFEPSIRLPPVLDVSVAADDPYRVGGTGTGEANIPGLRGLEESAHRDLDVLTRVSSNVIQYLLDSGLRSVSVSSSWMILGTRNFHRFRRTRRISWPCGTRFCLLSPPLLGFGVHSRIQGDGQPWETTHLKPAGRRSRRHQMSRSMSWGMVACRGQE